MVQPIAIHDEETWPSELRRLLDENEQLLQNYEAREASNELEKYGPDVTARYRLTNPYASPRSEVVARCDQLVAASELLGYHCTRLHEEEIVGVVATGLLQLSPELLEQRIRRRLTAGEIGESPSSRMLTEHMASLPERIGRVWVVFSAVSLRAEGGVGRFFRYWGGEALYASFDYRDPPIARHLERVGTGCIVEVQVPLAWLPEEFLGKTLLTAYYHRRHPSEFSSEPELEFAFARALPAHCIRRIIVASDADFRRLTGCSTWDHVPT